MPISYSKTIEIPSVAKGTSDGEIPLPLREGSEITTYTYVGSKLIMSSQDGESTFYFQDRLRNNRITTDPYGNIKDKFLSLPFGQTVIEGVNYGFTGKEKDESGLHYFGARYYDSDLGKFTSVDPVAENEPYSYVSNNPMNFIDPDGKLEVPQQAISDSRFFSNWYKGISRQGATPLSVGDVNKVVRAGQGHNLIPQSGFRFERHAGRNGWHMQFEGGGSRTLGNRHLPIDRASFIEEGWTRYTYRPRKGGRGLRLRPPAGGGSFGRTLGWIGVGIVVASSIPEIANAAQEGGVSGAASAAGGIGKNLVYDAMMFAASGGASALGQALGGFLSANAPAEFDPMFAAIRDNPEGLHAVRGQMSTGCYEYLCAITGVQSQTPDYSLPSALEGHVEMPSEPPM